MKVRNYFAMLRNVRNVIESDISDYHMEKYMLGLTNRSAIRKSLVLPFRFSTAYDEIAQMNGAWPRRFLPVLGEAAGIALDNVPRYPGRTLIVLDVSGSMIGQPVQIGSLFAAVLYKTNDADLMVFDTEARYMTLNPDTDVLALANSIRFDGGGTDFRTIFATANQAYDRAFVLSDMQGWVGAYSWLVRDSSQALDNLKSYRRRYNCDTKVYSFDLAGQGSMQFPAHELYCIAGWSDKVFDIVQILEEDREALVKTIEKVKL